jgi:hypothetical protein
MSLCVNQFRHIDLKEIVARIEPSTCSSKYRMTMPGKADNALMLTCWVLKELWKDGERHLRMDEITGHPFVKWDGSLPVFLPAVLKRLNRIRQIKLDVDREGAVITPGKAWIET